MARTISHIQEKAQLNFHIKKKDYVWLPKRFCTQFQLEFSEYQLGVLQSNSILTLSTRR